MFEKIQMILITILIPIGILYWYTNEKDVTIKEIFFPGVPVMHIGDIPVRVEIANSDAERTKGLSDRREFGRRVDGMLFVFPSPNYHGIWMKDMNFSIDIIWINKDLTVVGIEKNVQPETYPKTFRPSEPVLYALETDIHYADTFGISVGKKVRLPQRYLED